MEPSEEYEPGRRPVTHKQALTEREVQIADLMARGASNKQMARALNISTHTVKAHVSQVIHKLGAEGRTQAVVLWLSRAVQGTGRGSDEG